jgi:phosphoribosylglycinamide formyltransferase-1
LKNIILFASGNGTNAENICRYFSNHEEVRVAALFCNNPEAKVIGRMQPYHIPVHVFTKAQFNDREFFLPLIGHYQPSLIVLAGFLLLVPSYLVNAFPGRIINVHPALLPRYGGKGMYGHHVHEAVLAAKEKEHGITIHYVNDKFDEGEIIFQERFVVEEGDGHDAIAQKIAALEMKYFPEVIGRLLQNEKGNN